MKQARTTCWSCGYDTSSLPNGVCPECGNDARSFPKVKRVQHSGGIFFSALGALVIGSIGFARFTHASTHGNPGPDAWVDFGVLASFASIPGACAIWLMAVPPNHTSERTTSAIALLMLCGAASATAIWLRA